MVTVCVASYNGEKYIEEQIKSILQNLSDDDEVIISDDGSKDETRKILEDISANDGRIKIIDGPQKGLIKNFENAMRHANGDVIFLSDQDDIWTADKVEKVLKCFEDEECMLVLHNASVIDENENIILESFFEHRGSRAGVIKNIIKNSYIGCCMAIRKELLQYILPLPEKKCGLHDQWIGVIAELRGNVVFLEDKLLYYRRHGDNMSGMTHLPIDQMVANRFGFIVNLLKRWLSWK